jgi:hypothetical protein
MCCATWQKMQDESLDQVGLRWTLSRQPIFFHGSPFLVETEYPSKLRSERLRSRAHVKVTSKSASLQLAMETMLVVIPNLHLGKASL